LDLLQPAETGEIVRQEEATKGDGRVDTWSYFKDGKLVRREVDTKDREGRIRFSTTLATRSPEKSATKLGKEG